MIPCLPIQISENSLRLLDQRSVPGAEDYIECRNPEEVRDAIRDMVVRGAPSIGFAGIFGLALGVKQLKTLDWDEINRMGKLLKNARPTAVNLAYEIDRALAALEKASNPLEGFDLLKKFGEEQIALSEKNNRRMADFAIDELDKRLGKEKYKILTHCNTGFLACGSLGTALGVVQRLGELDRIEHVWVDETRPYLQGSRLTSFELSKLNIPHSIVVEGAASYLMKNHQVDAAFVGADRIVANGDTANKIGTSGLAIICAHYNVPFYVAAPSSTFDLEMSSGREIEIELRDENEILEFKGMRIAPANARALNPSFDITDAELISAIASEKGVALPPFRETIKDLHGNTKS